MRRPASESGHDPDATHGHVGVSAGASDGHADGYAPARYEEASYEARAVACYPGRRGCSACTPIPNHSIQRVIATERRFVTFPKDLYTVRDVGRRFLSVRGNASAGYVSNGGPPEAGIDAAPGCSSTYYQFDGAGEVDLRVTSPITGVPDYFVRFIVTPPR